MTPRQTAWDMDLSGRAQYFFAEALGGDAIHPRLDPMTNSVTGGLAHFSRARMKPKQLAAPIAEVAEMTRASLVALTGWDESRFQSVSDCGHLSGLLPALVGSPLYCEAMLDVLAQCLCVASLVAEACGTTDPDGLDDLLSVLLRELIAAIAQVDQAADERLKAEAPLRPLAAKEAKRAARVKEARHPDVDAWFNEAMAADPGKGLKALKRDAPQWVNDIIKPSGLKTRLAAWRKKQR